MDPTSRAAAAAKAYDLARGYDLAYGCCPQCVLAAVQETIGGIDDATIRAAHGLAGGGGLCGAGTCGALAGGLLALGARFGRPRDQLARGRFLKDFLKGKELVDRFRQEYGGVACEDLQRKFGGRFFDLWQDAEYKAFATARGERCAEVAGNVARWVVEMV